MAVLDLDHPEIGIIVGAFAGVGVDLGLGLSQAAGREVEPDALALAIAGRGVEPRAAVQPRHLHQHRPAIGIATPRHRRERPADFGAADQSLRPDLGFQLHGAIPMQIHQNARPIDLVFRFQRFGGQLLRHTLRIAAFLGALAVAAPAFAGNEAQMAYVERRGLLEADAQCRVLAPPVRAAMEASLDQARGALLRGGWTEPRIQDLDRAARSAARARPCDDPRTAAAAQRADAGYQAWRRAPSMTFEGAERVWIARRSPDAEGWRLRQDAPERAVFGVRESDGAQRLTLLVQAPRNTQFSTAQLLLRDPARANTAILDLPGRQARGLEAGAPSPQTARRFWANTRTFEQPESGARLMTFTFPDEAFEALMALDPRETIEARLGAESDAQRVLIEVGDIRAARAFLGLGG